MLMLLVLLGLPEIDGLREPQVLHPRSCALGSCDAVLFAVGSYEEGSHPACSLTLYQSSWYQAPQSAARQLPPPQSVPVVSLLPPLPVETALFK